MTMTDRELDDALARLPQMAPREPLWDSLEHRLAAANDSVRAGQRLWRWPLGWGVAALLVVGVTMVLVRPGPPNSIVTAELVRAPVSDVANTDRSQVGMPSAPRGRYARHLFSGDEAFRDALLEDELQRVEQAMLYAAPGEQRTLWQYRVQLLRQLVQVRYDTAVELYEF